jgi:predicted deacetylase
MQKCAIVAIHDVCPRNFSRIVKLRNFLIKQNINDFSYLVIPKWHNKENQDIRNNKIFIDFLKEDGRELVLHGLTHLNIFLDDEFSGIKYEKAAEKLREGKKIFQEAFGEKPKGFIPPMWMMNRNALHAIIDEGFNYTSSQKFFYNLRRNEKQKSTIVVRGGVLFIPSVINSVFRRKPIIQIALHPKDNIFKLNVLKRLINLARKKDYESLDRKSTRLNSSHSGHLVCRLLLEKKKLLKRLKQS